MSTIEPGAEFAPLERLLNDLAQGMSPSERKTLAGGIATELRAGNAKRERMNVEPPGEAMTARKRKKAGKRGVKAERMFQKASRASNLKKRATPDGAAVGFTGSTARIMNVHQYGLRDAVTKKPGAATALYPKREVLGFSAEDRARIMDRIGKQLTK